MSETVSSSQGCPGNLYAAENDPEQDPHPLSLNLLKFEITGMAMSHFNLLCFVKKLDFLKDLFTLFLSECVFFLHERRCTSFVLGAHRVLRGHQIPWLKVTVWMLELTQGPLQQGQVLLTTEPSPQTITCSLIKCILHFNE